MPDYAKPAEPFKLKRLPEPKFAPVQDKTGVPIPDDPEKERQARYEAAKQGRALSYLEFICLEWLVKVKKLVEDVDFEIKSQVQGGRGSHFGFETDFWFPQRRLAWQIQGLQFHHVQAAQRERDIITRAVLTGKGALVVELFEDDLLGRASFTLEMALRGIQVSRGR